MSFTKTITCPTTNLTITDAHCVVGEIRDTGVSLRIKVDVYQSAEHVGVYAPCNGKLGKYNVSGDDYQTYFAESVLDDAGKTLRTQAQAYLLAEVAEFDGGTPV